MKKSRYSWNIKNDEVINDIDILIDNMLTQRGLVTKEQRQEFLSDEETLTSPFVIKGMQEAHDRILSAINNNEKILIYGDFDADGITSVTLLYLTLTKLNANADYFIPNRFEHGYGPNLDVFKQTVEAGYSVVISVDNGITGVKEAKYLKENGVDYIIVDHHECPSVLPDAYVIVNPKQPDETSEFKEYCGAGLALKLSMALLGKLEKFYYDISAIGTVADMVPLLSDNRKIVRLALKEPSMYEPLKRFQNPKNKNFTTELIGFKIAPVINSIGRLDNAMRAVGFLTCFDEKLSMQYFNWMTNLNTKRKKLTSDSFMLAMELAETQNSEDDEVIVVYSKDFNKGIVGIIASRLIDKYMKPSIVLYHDTATNELRGSARSSSGFNLYEVFTECKDLIDEFGGHANAAGLGLKLNNLQTFKDKLNEIAKKSKIKFELEVDGWLSQDLDIDSLYEKLKVFEPYGMSNKNPLFLFKDCQVIEYRLFGQKNSHLELKLETPNLKAIIFNQEGIAEKLANKSTVDIVGSLTFSDYSKNVELLVKDIVIA